MATAQTLTGGAVGTGNVITLVDANGVNPTQPASILSDTLFLQKPTAAVMFGAAGSIGLTWLDGRQGSFKVTAGVLYPWAIKQFRSTGTVTIVSADIMVFYGSKIR